MKKWYKSKLFWLGLGQAVAAGGKYAVDGDPTALIGTITGALTVLLRFVTRQPIGL